MCKPPKKYQVYKFSNPPPQKKYVDPPVTYPPGLGSRPGLSVAFMTIQCGGRSREFDVETQTKIEKYKSKSRRKLTIKI